MAGDDALERGLAAARQAWPDLPVDAAAFLAWAGERVAPNARARARWADLYLAFACGRGVPAAIQRFDTTYLGHLGSEMARVGVGGDVDDLRQLLRTRFFVGREGDPPAIHQYSGEGALGGWVQVTIVRELLRLRDRQRRETALDDASLPGALISSDGPELAHLRGRYKDEFARAFRDAMGALDTTERLLLKHHYLDGLSIDELGQLQRIHRSTAARRVVKARDALFEGTRALLKQRLGLAGDELESLLRDVKSHLDLSMRLLKDATTPPPS